MPKQDLNPWERLMKLIGAIVAMVQDGSRDLKEVMEFADFFQIIKDKPSFFTDFKAFLASRKEPATTPQSELSLALDPRSLWTQIYAKLGITADFTDVPIPAKPEGDYWPIGVFKGILMNQIVLGLQKHFSVYLYTEDLDRSVTQNDRTAEKSYFIWVKATQEADPELKNLSANQLKKKEIKGITLLERLLLEALYFLVVKPGQHLDKENVTLCSGSRVSGGDVPCVGWDGDGVDVDWYGPDRRFVGTRGRAVVS